MSFIPFKVNVSVIIRRNDEFLLLKRADDEDVFPGLWGIPGGTVEPTDKNLEAALQRECLEEVDVVIGETKLISNNINDKGDKGALYLVYEAMYESGEPKALDGTADVQWLKIDQIRTLELTPMTLDIIEACL
jgi:8-oxo-dGTP diphosphatase